MSTYVIDRLIHFDNEAFVLYAATAPEDSLRIGAIASRCLTQLLDAKGEIVSKRDLMNGAWGAFGLEVTDNSLAQVIRQLRVALDKLQPGLELIVTVPRIGYKLGEAQIDLLDQPAPPAPVLAQADATPTPAPASQAEMPPRWQSRELLLGLAAVACWVLLFLLPGLLRPTALPERPFAEHQVEEFDGVHVHQEDMPNSALQPDNRRLAERAGQLAQALGMNEQDLHLYRFADQYRSLDLLCQGQLEIADSQCLGVQAHE